MLYCELDDAFNNKNYKFRESFSNNEDNNFNISKLDLNQFNSSNNQIMYESDKKGQDSDWASVDFDAELLPKKKSKVTWDNESIESNVSKEDKKPSKNTDTQMSENTRVSEMAGTTLSKLIKTKKPTHRECIKLYYNPSLKSNFCFDTALKHITKCELCKKEISKKKSVKFEENTKKEKVDEKMSCSSSLNSFINNLRQIKNKTKENFQLDNETIGEIIKSSKKTNLQEKNKINIKNNDNDVDNESKRMSEMQSQMELQSPPIKTVVPPASQEDNQKFQNMMIQNTIQKYFEEMEEKKELNDKLNKIYEILNLEIKKNEIIEKERNLTQIKNNSNSQEPNFNYILMCISIVIILLIVDIIIRIKF
jgi:hypothetical protein